MRIINSDYFRTYCALTKRNMIVIKKRYKSALINAAVSLFIQVFSFGALPLMGVSAHLIGPLFLGSQALSLFFLGMGFGLRIIFDIRYGRFIDYQLTLPLPKRWLFASYVTYFMMDATIISLPMLTLGSLFLALYFQEIAFQPLFFILIYCMALCFYGLLFLGLSFYYEYGWFMQNLWPRRLTWLITLAPLFYLWQSVHSFAPLLSYIMLVNPLTYIAEGMRATFIGGPRFISPWICIGMLIIAISAATWFVSLGIRKRLDPV